MENISTLRISELVVRLGCSFKLLIHLIFDFWISSLRTRSIVTTQPFSEANRQTQLFIRDQTAYAISTGSWETKRSFLSTIQAFQFARSLLGSLFNCQSCHVHMQGDVAHNMYPIPAVYQRIFNQLIQILHW